MVSFISRAPGIHSSTNGRRSNARGSFLILKKACPKRTKRSSKRSGKRCVVRAARRKNYSNHETPRTIRCRGNSPLSLPRLELKRSKTYFNETLDTQCLVRHLIRERTLSGKTC